MRLMWPLVKMSLRICSCTDMPRIWRKQPRSSGQDGDIGKNASLPCTTKRRTTTNLKTKNNQNCQIFKLHGSPTTKELKKRSSRLVGGEETGSQGGEDAQPRRWLVDQLAPRLLSDSWEEPLGSETDHRTQGFSMGNYRLKTSGCKNLWELWQWEKLSGSQESPWERPTGS